MVKLVTLQSLRCKITHVLCKDCGENWREIFASYKWKRFHFIFSVCSQFVWHNRCLKRICWRTFVLWCLNGRSVHHLLRMSGRDASEVLSVMLFNFQKIICFYCVCYILGQYFFMALEPCIGMVMNNAIEYANTNI